MPQLKLPAGTDVAEMDLFDIDALPRRRAPDDAAANALAAQGRLIRFQTGADGGYLLHLFVDEPIPDGLRRHCLDDDKLSGTFRTIKGNIGFGGLESAFAGFKPNPNIRSDGRIDPGDYSYTAFHTEFPDELLEQALRIEKTPGERWLARAPMLALLTAVVSGVVLAVAWRQPMAAVLAYVAGPLAFRRLTRIPAYQRLVARRKEAELGFPGIVVELRASHLSGRLA